MPRKWQALAGAAFALAVGFASTALAGSTQESDAAGVHVAVTPAGLAAQGPFWDFAVSFRSSGPALRDDPMRDVSLVADGQVQAPLAWQEMAPREAHHRAGVLRFAAPVSLPRLVEVRLQRSGEAGPRVFRWDLGGWFALGGPQD
jgi:hypothetical protein